MKSTKLLCLLVCFQIISLSMMAQGLGVEVDPPASILHTFENNTNTGVNAGFTLEQGGTGDALFQFLLSGGSAQRWVMGIDQSDAQKLKFASDTDLSSNARLTLTTAGFVGVGVTDPDAQVELENAATSNLHIRTTNTGLDYGAVFRLVEGPNYRGGYLQYDAAGNDLIIGIHDPDNTTTADDIEVLTITRPNGASIYNEAGLDADFRFEGDTDPNLLFIDAGANAVGIGTGTPGETLEVDGGILIGNTTGTNNGTIRYTGTDIEGLLGGSWTSLTAGAGGGGDFSNGGEAGGADRTLGNTDNFDLGFLTNNTNRLHIENDGDIGMGTTAPTGDLQVGQGSANTSLIVSGENAAGVASRIVLRDSTQTPTERVELLYDDLNNRFAIASTGTEVIRIDDGAINIQGNGVFQDNAFGASEWVIGQAEEGEVVCVVGSKVDEDGMVRAIVKPCDEENSSKVIGVVIPKDNSAHHGNPSFEFKDKLRKEHIFDWEEYWKTKHVGIELTGFRMVKVIGEVHVGDLLVSSGVSGYAMATGKPDLGAVIGKAVDNFSGKEGEKGMVWARIHLQSGSDLYDQIEELKKENTRLSYNVEILDAKIRRLEKLMNNKEVQITSSR